MTKFRTLSAKIPALSSGFRFSQSHCIAERKITYIRKGKKSPKVSYLNLYNDTVFFLATGEASYVLPRYDNLPFKEICLGEAFGHIDLGDQEKFFGSFDDPSVMAKSKISYFAIRRFTV